MSLKKVDYINQETIIEAENLNDIQDSIIALEETGPDAIVNTASGEAIVISDSSAKKLAGLNIYGKSTQAGTPTPTAPVDIVSVGEDGDVGIYVGEDRFVVTLEDGLRGIKVTDKTIATYTDSKGQMWCADEIDLARGVRIQRIEEWVIDGSITPTTFVDGNNGGSVAGYLYSDVMNGISTTRVPKMCDRLQAPALLHPTSYKDCKVGYWSFNSGGATMPDIFLVFNVGDFETAEDVADYLKVNPLTFIGILATPIETPLTAEQIEAYKALHTNKPNTTITNGENAYMTVKYIADPKSYIDNKVASAILAATVE